MTMWALIEKPYKPLRLWPTPPPPLHPLRRCITPGLISGNLLIRKWVNQTLFCLSHLAPSMNRPLTYTPSSYKQARQKKKITVRWLKRSFTFTNRIVRRVAKENLGTKLNLNLASWARGFCQNEFGGLSPRSVFYKLCTSKRGQRKKKKKLWFVLNNNNKKQTLRQQTASFHPQTQS